jgi:dTDP-4-dehydrorhamnose 3,5-epimerase
MRVVPLSLEGVVLVELPMHRDARGFFLERFQVMRFAAQGLPTDFVQDNHSRSAPGVLRGLHFQYQPPQGKLIGVIRGRIWDVVVDLRSQSPTFGQYLAVELSDQIGQWLWVPAGFAHGFCVLGEEPADVYYKVDAPYQPQGEGGIYYADAELNIPWPVPRPLLSERDARLGSFAAYRQQPKF